MNVHQSILLTFGSFFAFDDVGVFDDLPPLPLLGDFNVFGVFDDLPPFPPFPLFGDFDDFGVFDDFPPLLPFPLVPLGTLVGCV